MSAEPQGQTVDADASPETEVPQPPETDKEPKPKGSEAESSPAPDESGDSDERPKPKGVQKRLDELTRNWRETQRDRDYWREVAIRHQQQPQQIGPKAPSEPVKTLKDFEYDEGKYQSYLFDRARHEAVEAARAETSNWRQEQEKVSLRRSWESRVAEYAKEHDDFHDVFSDSTPVSEPMAEAIQASNLGPEIAYYLGNNPDIALRISNLSPISAAMEIGSIEASLKSERAKAKEKRVSGAPPPTPKVEAKDAALKVSPSDPDSDKMSSDEWFKARAKEIQSRRGK